MVRQEQNHGAQGTNCRATKSYVDMDSRPKNLSSLSNLKILSIQSNRLTSLSGLTELSHLEEIYVSHNALTEISGLDHNISLRVIDVSNNQISALTGLAHLTQLEELWASSNQLASFDEIERELADKKVLNTVYFEGNPLQKNAPVLYRNKVRLALPQVKQIDASKCLNLIALWIRLMMASVCTTILMGVFRICLALESVYCSAVADGSKQQFLALRRFKREENDHVWYFR